MLLHLLGDKVKELINSSSVFSYKFKKEETVQSAAKNQAHLVFSPSSVP